MTDTGDQPTAPQAFACPLCGGRRWMGLGGVDPSPLALPEVGRDGKVSKAFSVVGLACSACGFVRLHSLDVFGGGSPESRGVG